MRLRWSPSQHVPHQGPAHQGREPRSVLLFHQSLPQHPIKRRPLPIRQPQMQLHLPGRQCRPRRRDPEGRRRLRGGPRAAARQTRDQLQSRVDHRLQHLLLLRHQVRGRPSQGLPHARPAEDPRAHLHHPRVLSAAGVCSQSLLPQDDWSRAAAGVPSRLFHGLHL